MTTDNLEKKAIGNSVSVGVNRWLYGLLVITSLYFLFKQDYMSAASNLGIALIFDPFDQSVKWQDRKIYQRVWLIVHLTLSIGLLVYGIFIDKH